MTALTNFYNEQIRVQEQSIRSYKITMLILIFVGIIIFIAPLFIKEGKNIPDILKLGASLFTSALALLPFREITSRREKIISLKFIKDTIENSKNSPSEITKSTEITFEFVNNILKK